MKRRSQNRESSPQSRLPFPGQLLPDDNASHPYKPGPSDSGILHHSSRGVIQDAAEYSPRFTVAALVEFLMLLRSLDEQARSGDPFGPGSRDTGG